MSEYKQLKSDLTPHWVIAGMMLCMLIAYNIVCHTVGVEIQIKMAEEQRIFVRTVFYFVAIIMFPVVSLLRHILLRLNQTMPGDNPAKNRYLVTIIVTMSAIEIVSVFGFIMFVFGDGYNTLYIFSVLGALGIFLHRPQEEEYKQIIEALKQQRA
ncbi:MAG: hypothetical protein ACKE51_06500 [Methylococcaceae bacterium]